MAVDLGKVLFGLGIIVEFGLEVTQAVVGSGEGSGEGFVLREGEDSLLVGSDEADFVSHFVGVDAIEDTIDFGFEKLLVEFVASGGLLGDDLFGNVLFFELVLFGGVGGEVAAGIAEDTSEGGAVGAKVGRFDARLIFCDGSVDIINMEDELGKAILHRDFIAINGATNTHDDDESHDTAGYNPSVFGVQNFVQQALLLGLSFDGNLVEVFFFVHIIIYIARRTAGRYQCAIITL